MLKRILAFLIAPPAVMGFLGSIATIAGWLEIKPESLLGIILSPFVVLITWLFNEHAVYGWVIAPLGICALIILAKLVMSAIQDKPAYLKYRSANVHGVDCAWRWSYGRPDDIKWLCPSCQGELVSEGSGYFDSKTFANLICLGCSKVVKDFKCDEDQMEEIFIKEIERVARAQYDLPLHPH